MSAGSRGREGIGLRVGAWAPRSLRGGSLRLVLLLLALAGSARSVCASAASSRQTEMEKTDLNRKAFLTRLVDAALERTKHNVTYDGRYVVMKYPGGDVPDDRGVCTDVIVRAYRKVGVDLQRDVHEDMRAHFSAYPKLWGLRRPDPNIDHRRVQNLTTFFRRKGETLPVTRNPSDYTPGDLVAWQLDNGMQHIGIVINRRSADKRRPLCVHNIGAGPKAEDILFEWKLTGHYRYVGMTSSAVTRDRPDSAR